MRQACFATWHAAWGPTYAIFGHLVLERPALRSVEARYPVLISPAKSAMQLLWQPEMLGLRTMCSSEYSTRSASPQSEGHRAYSSSSRHTALEPNDHIMGGARGELLVVHSVNFRPRHMHAASQQAIWLLMYSNHMTIILSKT